MFINGQNGSVTSDFPDKTKSSNGLRDSGLICWMIKHHCGYLFPIKSIDSYIANPYGNGIQKPKRNVAQLRWLSSGAKAPRIETNK